MKLYKKRITETLCRKVMCFYNKRKFHTIRTLKKPKTQFERINRVCFTFILTRLLLNPIKKLNFLSLSIHRKKERERENGALFITFSKLPKLLKIIKRSILQNMQPGTHNPNESGVESRLIKQSGYIPTHANVTHSYKPQPI